MRHWCCNTLQCTTGCLLCAIGACFISILSCCVPLCAAVCCCVLLCATVCGSVWQCVAVCGSVLQCVAVCCSALQCVAVRCSVWQCVAVCSGTRLTCTPYAFKPILWNPPFDSLPTCVMSQVISVAMSYVMRQVVCDKEGHFFVLLSNVSKRYLHTTRACACLHTARACGCLRAIRFRPVANL